MSEPLVGWLKKPHAKDCDGVVVNKHKRTTVDRLGREGNGGLIVHIYQCNRSWSGCPGRVFVTEKAFRSLAAEIAGEAG